MRVFQIVLVNNQKLVPDLSRMLDILKVFARYKLWWREWRQAKRSHYEDRLEKAIKNKKRTYGKLRLNLMNFQNHGALDLEILKAQYHV